MDKLIKFCIERKNVTIATSIFILLFGIYSYTSMSRQEMPDTSSPAVQITTVYPGASAKTVAEQVTKKVEDQVAMLEGVDYLSSISNDNISVVYGVLEYNVDYDKQWEKLRTSLENLKTQMPDGVQPFDINTDLVETNDLILVFSSPNYDSTRLKDIAENFKSKLVGVKGIRKIDIDGEKKNRIQIEVDYAKLNTMSIGIDDIMKIIKAQNAVIPIGDIQANSGKINVDMPKALEKLDDFKNIIIDINPDNGIITRLSDIAVIEFKQKPQDNYFLKDGNSAVMLGAKFNKNLNIVPIGEEVKKIVKELKSQYPEDLNIDEMIFQPDDVKTSVNDFIINLLEGILFVIIVIFVGMGVRNAFVVSISIPMSIAATFLYMEQAKIQLHQVSISALIIALGMLVDNAIVISDAVQEHINTGLENQEAAYRGAREQMIPIFTSTLTTLAAFSPLISLPGEAGEFLSSLPVIVIVALGASFLAAIFVIPTLTSMSLIEFQPKNNIINKFSNLYTKLFENNIKHNKMLVFALILIIGASLFGFKQFVDIKMFPYVDKNIVYLNITNDITGNIENTEELVLEAEKLLRTQPEITETYVAVGGSLPRFYMTQDFIFPSEAHAQIFARYDMSKSKYSNYEDLKFGLQKLFDNNFKNGYASVRLLEIKIPGPNIEIRAYSDDDERLLEVSNQIYEYLQSLNTTNNVQIEKPNYKYQYNVNIDDSLAMRAGLTRYDIQLQTSLGLGGMNITQLNNGGDNYDIFLTSNVNNIEDLSNFRIKSGITGNKSALRNIADIHIKSESDSIRRYDRKNMIYVSSNVIPKVGTASIQANVEEFIKTLDTDGIEFHFGGDSLTTNKYLTGLLKASLIAIGLIYIILLVQFNSFIKPLVIMATVLLAMIGIIAALLLTRTNFTFTVGLGAASLMGIVVNNGILLIEYIDRARADGLDVLDACRSSVSRRMRPILLSSVTTIFGLIPLIFANSSFFTPMAIALMGGLLIATFTTITVIPVIYYMIYNRIQKKI